jgi:hypothetical protein
LEAEEILEDIGKMAEDVADVVEAVEALALEAGMAESVVESPLLGVAEDLVSLGSFLEPFLGFVAGIAVGMELQGPLPVSGLDLTVAGLALEAQDFIVTALHTGTPRTQIIIILGLSTAIPALF